MAGPGLRKSLVAGLSIALVVYWLLDWTSISDINRYYKGKRVLLTGASKGIGKELAVQLAQVGAELFITARSVKQLDATAEECRRAGARVHTLVADVGKEEDCERLAQDAIRTMGGVDMLILNAAYSYKPSFFNQLENSDTVFTDVFRVNLLQSVNLVQHLMSSLVSAKGHIVAVSSAASIIGMPQVAAYSSSKHALNGFFKSLRQEFILNNVPVDITIMPLPYVLTEKAVDNWKPTSEAIGITAEECAKAMMQTMPSRKAWIYIDWSSYFISIISSIFPSLTDYCVRIYVGQTSLLFRE